ncbi:hypothetical protein BCR36DRAFT_349756, partial [Piromyces finnis]
MVNKKNYINLKQYRLIESSCNRAFSSREYKVERYTTKPKYRYFLQDQTHPTTNIILNQSQFDAFIESEKLKKQYEEEEILQEKLEKKMHKRISDKIKENQLKLSNYIEKVINEMK